MRRLRDAEEVVRQDRDRLNLIIENVGDPIVVGRLPAKIVLVDPLAKELFGIEPKLFATALQVPEPDQARRLLIAFTFSFAERKPLPSPL